MNIAKNHGWALWVGILAQIFSLLTLQNRVGKFGGLLITVCTNYNWKKKKRYQWVYTLANQHLQVRPYFPSLAQYSGAKVKGATKTCNLFCNLLSAGLLIFCAVTEPQNSRKSAKFTKTHKMPRNLLEIISNICLYNIFETYLGYWGYGPYYIDCFSEKFTSKIPAKIPQKKADFTVNLSLKIPQNLTFFPRLIRSPVSGIVRQFSFCFFFRGKLLYRQAVNNKLIQ